MGQNTILRVLSNVELNEELVKSLRELLQDFTIERFDKEPDYKNCIQERINSIHNAFLFLLKAYPPNPYDAKTLADFAQQCKKELNLSHDDFDAQHKELVLFTARIVQAISIGWEWPSSKKLNEAMECLNEAEVYHLMTKERPVIATLTPMPTSNEKEQLILQVDKPIPAYYKQLIEELIFLKDRQFPKTPDWFYKCPDYQQAYLCHLKIRDAELKDIIEDFNQFLGAWEQAKKKANCINTDLLLISKQEVTPAWYNNLKPHCQEMLLLLSTKTSSLIDEELQKFKRTLLSIPQQDAPVLFLIPRLPQWYWVLPKRQQYFLEYQLKNSETIESALSFISSRQRFLPLPANLESHNLYSINQSRIKELSVDRLRSSHIASRNMLTYPKSVQERHVSSNLETIIKQAKEKQPVLFSTLISPIHAQEYLPQLAIDTVKNLVDFPPDLELYNLALGAINKKASINILETNHPYNMAKRWYYTPTNCPKSKNLINLAEKYSTNHPDLRKLIDEYKEVLDSPTGSATFWDYDGRELFLSSLEQLIIIHIAGLSYGSCVSGKDRKAIESIHTDAMIIFKELYGYWPKFGAPKEEWERRDRLRFVEIVADLYISRHHQTLAGHNAPGASGTKTPAVYLPADIVEAINRKIISKESLRKDDRIATDNEIKNISKKLSSRFMDENVLKCHLMAEQIGEQNCTILYNVLHAFLNETKLFISKDNTLFKTKLPSGVEEMRTILHNSNTGLNNIARMKKIFKIALERPEEDKTRTEATKSLYKHLRDFFEPIVQNECIYDRVLKAQKAWLQWFENSKCQNQTDFNIKEPLELKL